SSRVEGLVRSCMGARDCLRPCKRPRPDQATAPQAATRTRHYVAWLSVVGGSPADAATGETCPENRASWHMCACMPVRYVVAVQGRASVRGRGRSISFTYSEAACQLVLRTRWP